MAARISKSLNAKLARVRLFLCDVDGVLTDGTVLIGKDAEHKRFHIRDGLGLRLLQQNGVKVGWVSHRPSPATTRRARELKIDFLHQKSVAKVGAIEKILNQAGVSWSEVCYVGDDLFDLGALRRAGVGVSVADGLTEARELADYVTKLPGGQGAIREIAEMILKAHGKWDGVIKEQLT
ncbi:MAG: KdsC family phosphatase [Verrucomicrobiia bacterium]|jgi:3-deoxy-D-manno-octulosonate 8-phosphate phosphatase (KDO 8-P phosphatase)